MAADGEYARLFSTQAKRYIEAAQEQAEEGAAAPGPGGFPGRGGFRPPEGFKMPEGFKPPEGGFRPPQGGFPGGGPKTEE